MRAMRPVRRSVAVLASAALVLGGVSALAPVASAKPLNGSRLTTSPGKLARPGTADNQAKPVNPSAAKSDQRKTFLVQLAATPTTRAFGNARSQGTTAAKKAAKSQLTQIRTAQKSLIDRLPTGTSVVYRTHSVLAGVAVSTKESNLERLKALPGVAAVYPIAPKTFSNAYAVPFQGAPAVWTGRGDLGQDTTVAIIDTGLDYTHANFGGPGTKAAFTAAQAAEASPADPSLYPNDKIIGGADLVGDDYNADPTSPSYNPTPAPDSNPLDCNGHGSHVGGSAAGLGENADGSTYTGSYNANTPFSSMRIGPGMAPAAKLYAYKVFGCDGSTDVTAQAIDAASDPNGDGDPSDHVDVINMSLGSAYGSPQDGDAVVSNAATELGITVVASAGNEGDITDVAGSPGNAAKVLSVAATQDASNVVDGLKVTIGSGPQTLHAASRAVLYDWDTKPDLIGTVAAPVTNKTACTALSPSDAALVNGKVAFIEWNDATPECGSIARGGNLAAAGAIGFIFGSTSETFSAGINGSATIPGVLLAKSGGDAIRSALAAGTPVTADGTLVNGVSQLFPADNDKIASFSSRGIHAKANLKPDVAAVGASVFSTAVGTGNEGVSESGTSMAAPMVAGLAALVKSAHPNWTAAQVKADIMNTAGQDVYANGSADPSSLKYAPVRVGAGRIKADAALANDVLAYNAEDAGTVSVGFGPVEVTGPMTLTKKIKVENTGLSVRTYSTSYEAITSVPGVTYTVSPASVTLSARSSTTVTVTFTVTDATALTKTVDPTIGRISTVGYPRETLAEASGRVLLTPSSSNLTTLRVPVYSAPRPASVMTQASSLTLPKGATQSAELKLTGQDVDQGTGDESIFSIAAGAELQATSGLAPKCTTSVTVACYRLPEERSADLKYVGYTSDYPQYNDAGESQAYFAITTHGPWSIPASKVSFQIDIDLDGDKTADLYLYTTRLGEDDIFVTELFDPQVGVVDTELVNARFGDVDTALYDSDTLLMPLYLKALEAYGVNAANPRISYGIETYSAYTSNPIDLVGVDAASGKLKNPLSANLYAPGITVSDAGGAPLLLDESGSVKTVTRNLASYRADKGAGLLMLHLHNKVGNKAQVVALKSAVSVGLTVSPTSIKRGQSFKATVKVTDPDGGTAPSGTVKLVDQAGKTVASGSLSGGSKVFTVSPGAVGTLKLKAVYSGDATHLGATSSVKSVTVAKSTSSVSVSLSPKTGDDKKTTSATVKVKAVLGVNATGKVVLVRTSGAKPGVVASGTLKNGSAVLKFKPKQGTYSYQAQYVGNGSYAAGSSAKVSYRAK